MKKIFLNLLLGTALLCNTVPAFAQNNANAKSELSIPSTNGSVAMSLKKYDIKQNEAVNSLNQWLGLSDNYSFEQVSETQDKMGFIQIKFQQLFKNVPLKDGMVILHFKNGIATSINGRLSNVDEKTNVTPVLSRDEALQSAQEQLTVKKLLNTYPIELSLLNNQELGGSALAWKVRIDGKNAKNTLVMANVFIDAVTGKAIQVISLIAHADVTATGETLYSGTQTITTDSYTEGYRLRDNARKIETYDVGGVPQTSNWSSNILFDTAYDLANATTTWGTIPTLMSMKLQATSPSLLSTANPGILLSFISENSFSSIDDGLPLSFNIFYSLLTQANLPLTTPGLYLPLPKPTYEAGYLKLGMNGMDIIDSAYFTITDKSIGIHPWSDPLGNAGTYTMELAKNPALDAHWGMEKTHDFYLQELNRDSYDDNGSVLRNYMNGMLLMSFTQTNAAALPDPYNSMVYGLGDGVIMGPVVGLDVMGHEFTHLVTGNTANLDYEGESGALNESFSDIFGTCIEFFTKGAQANWTIGEDVILGSNPGFFRSMSNPKATASANNPNFPPQPDTYKKQYWQSTTNPNDGNDNGGVHTNSGIGNKWFYLLTEGGTGTNDNSYVYNVTGIGIEKSQQIAYRTLTAYLTPNAQYIDAYHASLQATEDLYGDTSVAYTSVKDAWIAVGVADSLPLNVQTANPLKEKLAVYPNPTNGHFTINNTSDQVFTADLVSILGVNIQKIEIKRGTNSVNIAALSKGVYFLNIHTPAGIISQKVVLK